MEHDEEFQKVLTYAAAQLAEGQKPRHLKADLIARGAPPEVAEQALAIARQRKREECRRAGWEMFVQGLVLLTGGALFTGVTYAWSGYGGPLIAATGALAFGFAYTVVGVLRMMTGWNIN